jgi:hypothetical protein
MLFVFNDEHTLHLGSAGRFQCKRAPSIGAFTLGPGSAAMPLCHRPNDEEPLIRCPSPEEPCVRDPVEALEDALQVGLRHANTVVFDADGKPRRLALAPALRLPHGLTGVLDGVVEQVGDSGFQLLEVPDTVACSTERRYSSASSGR